MMKTPVVVESTLTLNFADLEEVEVAAAKEEVAAAREEVELKGARKRESARLMPKRRFDTRVIAVTDVTTAAITRNPTRKEDSGTMSSYDTLDS